jgi:hypothetical protein
MTRANATFQIQSWDEQPYTEREGGGKLTEAKVQQAVTGDFEGISDVRWLMAYSAQDRAEFVGIQTLSCSLGGLEGSFVLRSAGTFDGSQAAGELMVVEGSGESELAGISGSGSFTSPMGDTASMSLEYALG